MRTRQRVRGIIGALRPVPPRRVAALLLAAVGLVGVGVGAAVTAVLTTEPGPRAAHAEARGMGRSAPVRIAIPAIDVDTGVVPLRLRSGELEAPPAGRAGWYEQGTSPGEPGSAVIVGAAGSGGRAAVFGRLARLAAGDRITVLRADQTRARFVVERVAAYSPVDRAGPGGNGAASLRLVPSYRAGPSPPAAPVVFARLTP